MTLLKRLVSQRTFMTRSLECGDQKQVTSSKSGRRHGRWKHGQDLVTGTWATWIDQSGGCRDPRSLNLNLVENKPDISATGIGQEYDQMEVWPVSCDDVQRP